MTNFRKPHVYRDPYGYIIIDGHTFMGRNRVPPMPNRIALTDRTTGETKVLSHDVGASNLVLADVTASMSDVQRYGSHGGPYSGDYRLYLDNGALAFEYAQGYASQRILTRRAFDTTVLELTVDLTNGSVVYTQIDL